MPLQASYFEDVQRFCRKFDIHPRSIFPHVLDDDLFEFRFNFMLEELREFESAFYQRDLEGMFDSLIDLVYVALGTAFFMSVPFDKGWKRVHAANMTKMRAKTEAESKRGSYLDVVKPAGWQRPDLSDLL